MTDAWPYHLCFETLSNDLRLQILQRLKERSYSVSELCEALSAEQSKVSHSLAMLRLCNYVDVESKGKNRIYSLNPVVREGLKLEENHANIFHLVDAHIAKCCHFECKKLTVHA